MAEEWKNAFKAIYGKSPGKADYALAPDSIAKSVLESTEIVKEDEKSHDLFAPTRLKRPAQYSPVKQLVKRRAVQPKEEDIEQKPVQVPVRESPRKRVKPMPALAASPVKKALFAPLSGESCFKSPTKVIKTVGGSPRKTSGDTLNHSPRKPLHRRNVTISSADALYETKSPVKQLKETEDKPSNELEVMDEESLEGLRVKINKRKKSDTNFLKLNMKKGYHAKGKLTAEQKRKFKKKANFKKFKSG